MVQTRSSTPTVLGKRSINSLNNEFSPESPDRKTKCASSNFVISVPLTPPVTPTKMKCFGKENVKTLGLSPKTSKASSSNPFESTPSVTPLSTPSTPSTPSIYTGAKTLFQRGTNTDSKLLCRDEERETLKLFMEERVVSKQSGAMYISGPPGTGKSALVSEVCADVRNNFCRKVKMTYINCMSLRKPTSVFARILHDFTGETLSDADVTSEEYSNKFKSLFTDKRKKLSCIVVLDEMDYLITKGQEVLYQIFEWTRLSGSRLIVVGIANALNLTSRFLPKLKARNFVPDLLRFTPYTAEQIATVISHRLQIYSSSLGSDIACREHAATLIHPAAIQLCARKTAASTGDLRKAFDICKLGLDLAEEEARRKFSQELGAGKQESPVHTPTSTPSRTSSRFEIPADAVPPKVTISHISRICSVAFGGSTVQRIQGLNLQQKAVLCALIVGEKKYHRSLNTRELYEHYGSLCAKDKLLDSLKATEFKEVISALEVCGAVNLSSSKARGSGDTGGSELRRISSAIQEIDLLRAVADVGLLNRFFADHN